MHTKTIDETFKELKTGLQGLSSTEAEKRLQEHGKNELTVKRKTPWWVHFIKEFTDLMVVILIIAATIALIAGEHRDAIVILVIVLINAIIGFVQKFKAEKAIEALKKMVAPNARVIRDGKEMQIDAKLLVPGDIIILAEGDRITADARIIEESQLETQEAPLTGESVPVHKHANASESETANSIFMGTDIVHGTGKAVVVSTGMQTKFGKIANLTTTTKKDKSPLQKELFRIGVLVGKITLVISAILLATGYFIQKQEFVDTFLFATSVAVAAVPEGLPATVTIALALGVQRLAKRNAIVRQLASVETLGSTTHICTDKTGTLTRNEMTVKELYFGCCSAQISGAGYKPAGTVLIKNPQKQAFQIGNLDSLEEDYKLRKQHLNKLKERDAGVYSNLELMCKISALCNNAKLVKEEDNQDYKYSILGDPTEGALLTLANKCGLKSEDLLSQHEKIYELPFDSVRKCMSTIHKKDEKTLMLTKGAPDEVLDKCTHYMEDGEIKELTSEKRQEILKQNEKMAKKALRIISFAYKEIEIKDEYSAKEDEKNLVFVGLSGMIDPPRRDVKKAVHLAHKAGIKVYIVTGDHGLTAEAIAKQIGLVTENDNHIIITGKDMEKLSDEELSKLLEDQNKNIIFARVAPEHKLKIVSTLKEHGHIVAVTGDGVNDAPALKRADIGIAMGITGTDVSKEASNMVLADDSFSTIIKAVKEGRTIYENMKKFIFYIFSCNIGELITIFTAIIIGLPAPLTAILILSVDIGTDVLPALALGVDPPEKGIMLKPPRDPKKKIMEKPFVKRYLYVGFFIGAIVISTFMWSLFNQGWQWGQELDTESFAYMKSSTFAFVILVMIQMVNAYNSRSDHQSVFKMGIFSNLFLLGAVFVSLGVVYLLVQVPFFQDWIHTTGLEWYEWMVVIGASFSILLVEEIRKGIVRLKLKKANA